MAEEKSPPKITYSCYYDVSREGEQFVPEHVFSYQVSGTLMANDGRKKYVFREGDFHFSRRNQLMKFVKLPPEGGEFKSVSILLDQETLREISAEFNYSSFNREFEGQGVTILKPNPLYKSFMDSLMPYLLMPHPKNETLFSLKVKEAVLILLKVNPELKDILFDFREPGKIDLEAYMQKNFRFNVGINRFAYLTGRSLATFKRDFAKIFHAPPSKWLQQKRLQEAYYLIREKGQKPSEVYLEVGFKDFSHFSYAFKNFFGSNPSSVLAGSTGKR